MVEHIVENFRPRRFSAMVLKAAAAIELPAGTVKRTNTGIGDHIQIVRK